MRLHIAIALLVFQIPLSVSSQAATLHGTVKYTDGSAAAGAVVYAVPKQKRISIRNNMVMGGEAVPRSITDRQGKFEIDLGASEAEMVLAQDMEDALGFQTLDGSNPSCDVTIEPPATVQLQVQNGPIPVAAEEVTFTLHSTAPGLAFQYAGTTNAGGALQVSSLTPGKYVVRTAQPVPQVGCCFRSVITRQASVQFTPGAVETLQLGGTDLPLLEGVVRDADGSPLHGVWVRLLKQEGQQPDDPVWSTVTDKEGRYAIYDVPEGKYELRCFRRLALNDALRTLQASESVTIGGGAPRARNAKDVAIDLAEFQPLRIGDAAPAFAATLTNGDRFDVADYKGKWLVVHFFASWCMPCVQTIGEFDQLLSEMNSEKIAVVGVSLDETPADLQVFIEEKRINHPVLFDGPWSKSKAVPAYRITSIPSTVIIAPDGAIAQIDLHGDVLHTFLARQF